MKSNSLIDDIRQINNFLYLSHNSLLGIPDDNGIFRSRDHRHLCSKNISAGNQGRTFPMDKLIKENKEKQLSWMQRSPIVKDN